MTAREPLDLNRLAALDARATPGPWRVVLDDTESPTTVWQVCASPSHTDEVDPNGDTVFDCCDDGGLHGEPFFLEADAAFVAEARTALPALVAEVRALRAELTETEDDRDELSQLLAPAQAGRDEAVAEIERLTAQLAIAEGALRDLRRMVAAFDTPGDPGRVRAFVGDADQIALRGLGELPERTAVPGEPLPPIPDSAYPAGATPLDADAAPAWRIVLVDNGGYNAEPLLVLPHRYTVREAAHADRETLRLHHPSTRHAAWEVWSGERLAHELEQAGRR